MAGNNNNEIPAWAKRFVSSDDLGKIGQAVASAELKTRGEIIPMLVSRSSGSHMVPYTLSLLWAILVLLLVARRTDLLFVNRYWWVVPVVVIAGSAVAFVVGKTPLLQKLFTHPLDRHAQVLARAELEFHRQQLDKTPDHSAVLIFASAFERDVVVLADSKIAEKLPAEIWSEVVTILAHGFSSKKASHGWVRAIEKCGEILAQQMPPSPAHKKSFNDSLIIKN